MGNAANFMVDSVLPGLVVLTDVGPWTLCRTITNDAERVVDRIYAKYGNVRIIYHNSEGERVELIHDNGRFIDYAEPTD